MTKLIAGIGALLLFVLGALGLRKGGKDAVRREQAENEIKTRNNVDEAVRDSRKDSSDWRDRLRKRKH
jgi:hypothetical protein